MFKIENKDFSFKTAIYSAGANPFDPLESLDHIQNLKKQVDYVIVLYHGGKEHYRYPSPNLQKTCRKIIEKGGDLVICQHTHCIGCEEKWKDGIIVYGQGNFLFDEDDNEFWQTSLLVNIKDNFEIEYIPILKDSFSVRLADKKSKDKILSDFYRRSEEIKQKDFIEKEYEKIAIAEYIRYLSMAQGNRYNSLLFRVINKLTGHKLKECILKYFYFKNDTATLYNLVACEAHREIFLYLLSKKIK